MEEPGRDQSKCEGGRPPIAKPEAAFEDQGKCDHGCGRHECWRRTRDEDRLSKKEIRDDLEINRGAQIE